MGNVTLKYVNSESNIAGEFTKPLGRLNFDKIVKKVCNGVDIHDFVEVGMMLKKLSECYMFKSIRTK